MDNIKQLWNQYREVIMYLIFGVLTTAINYIIYLLLRLPAIDMNSSVANCIAWFFSVLFAFITNKIWVFESKTNGFFEYFIEGVKFFGARFGTLVFELVFMYIFVTKLQYNEMIFKAIAQVAIIVLNYVLSKILVFRDKK